MSRLFIVRHGDTFEMGDTPRRIGARSNLPLVRSGRTQAAALGDCFRESSISFDCAFAGPLARTRDTALAILQGRKQPTLQIVGWLAEIDHGPDEGRSEAEVLARIGVDALAAWDRNAVAPVEWRLNKAKRLAAWRALLKAPPAGDTLLVTSNGAARFVFLASEIERPASGLKLRTGAYGIIERQQENWRLIAWDERPPPIRYDDRSA